MFKAERQVKLIAADIFASLKRKKIVAEVVQRDEVSVVVTLRAGDVDAMRSFLMNRVTPKVRWIEYTQHIDTIRDARKANTKVELVVEGEIESFTKAKVVGVVRSTGLPYSTDSTTAVRGWHNTSNGYRVGTVYLNGKDELYVRYEMGHWSHRHVHSSPEALANYKASRKVEFDQIEAAFKAAGYVVERDVKPARGDSVYDLVVYGFSA